MEFTKIMTERRAVNFFDPTKPVNDDELKKIIETAAIELQLSTLAGNCLI